jgi:hypothetical protein
MTCHTGTAPVGQGGVVRDGVYVLVSMDYYGSLGCQTQSPTRAVWDICASTWATAHDDPNGTNGISTLTSTATITSATVSLALSCPAGSSSSSATFDATDTTLTLYWSDGFDGAYIEHYAKE